MAATKYQVLYRYMNDIMNIAITNDQGSTYDEVREFYTDPDHRIFSTDMNIQNEELDKQQELISYANQSSNPKNDMLFVYDGTKKILHQKYVEQATGYVVKHWQLIPRSKIGDQGDFTKDFTTLNAATVEDGGTVVCTQAVMNKYFKAGVAVPAGNYTSDELTKMVDDYSIFQLKDEDWTVYAAKSGSASRTSSSYGGGTTTTLYSGPVFVDGAEARKTSYTGYNGGSRSTITGCPTEDGVYGVLSIAVSHLETTDIPGHYADQPGNPYMIKDCYRRIESSPWLVNCTVGSLTAALGKAKKLIEMIGMENVKVIKLVEVDQFIKIR